MKMLIVFAVVMATAFLFMQLLLHSGIIRPPFTRHGEERILTFRQLVDKELAGEESISPEVRDRLTSILTVYTSGFKGQGWITSSDGSIIAKSYTHGTPLDGSEELEVTMETPEGDTLHLLEKGDEKNIYLTGSVVFQGEELTVHLLHEWRARKLKLWFLEGLGLMAAIASLLLIPASRRLTKPLNKLTDSAKQVAEGDFSPRVHIKGRSEVTVLAEAFNHMAENLDKMVKGSQELTANLSHELRSPLARIRMSQQILQDRLEAGRTDGQEKHLNKMEAEIAHMDSLIDKILSLSKLDLAEPSPHNDDVAIEALLSEATHKYQPIANDKSITIEHGASIAQSYRCNRENLQIVFDNVLSNAIKYCETNGNITLTALVDHDEIIVRCSNPYPQLSQSELDTIFVPFKRLGYDDVEGNGLGLAFAHKIIKDHGGTMTPSSDADGFHMEVRLPL